jgi:hypothetical protein
LPVSADSATLSRRCAGGIPVSLLEETICRPGMPVFDAVG